MSMCRIWWRGSRYVINFDSLSFFLILWSRGKLDVLLLLLFDILLHLVKCVSSFF